MRVSPALFESTKKCNDFGKKGPNCAYYWVKFSIHNVILRVSRRKNSKLFRCRASFSCILTKCLLKRPSSTTSPLPRKVPDCAPALRHYSFGKTLNLKCLTVFQIGLCLSNCSVIFTVTLCYILQQAHSE